MLTVPDVHRRRAAQVVTMSARCRYAEAAPVLSVTVTSSATSTVWKTAALTTSQSARVVLQVPYQCYTVLANYSLGTLLLNE